MVVNRKVIEQSHQPIAAMNCVKFIGSRGRDIVPEDALTHHLETQEPYARFCPDISRGVHEGWTVTYAALQIAFFLGFDEVVIIGMDHRYQYEGKPNEARRLDGVDPNHFMPNYFGGGSSGTIRISRSPRNPTVSPEQSSRRQEDVCWMLPWVAPVPSSRKPITRNYLQTFDHVSTCHHVGPVGVPAEISRSHRLP